MKKQMLSIFCIMICFLSSNAMLKCRAYSMEEEAGSNKTAGEEVGRSIEEWEISGETKPEDEMDMMGMGAEKIPQKLEQIWDETYMQDITGYLDSTYGENALDAGQLWKDIISGNLKDGLKDFGGRFLKSFFFEFSAGKEIFMTILILAVLSSLFTVVMDIVENRQVSQLGFYFIYMLLCIMLGEVFQIVYEETGGLLLSVTDFVKVLIPAYAAALGMTSGTSTSIVYYEGILIVIWCVEELLYRIILPCIEFYVFLSIINGIWTEEKLNLMLQSLKKGIEFILKAVLWIIGSMGVLQSMITPVIDSLKWNTAKKLVSVVPGVGNISDGISEIFVGSAVLIRNGIGVFFTVILLFICIVPLCKVFAVAGCLKAASALGAVVNHSRLTSCSDKVADASFLLCRVLLTGMGLFLMSIAITILAANRNF